ncbi:MAG: hypothetical protein JO188_02395 [Hyphomicrobiales bacterium]|nr:hypothetical protein [Hyphomicrobiales bacterium]
MPPNAFPEIGPLITAAKADGIDARMVLTRVLVDLFVGRSWHSRDELIQFEALVEPLIRIVDTHTAAAIAGKLARHAETPRGVIEGLLAREDEASYIVLRDAVMLDQRTLDILAERGSGLVAVAIASRAEITETTARILVFRDEASIDSALARNTALNLPSDVVSLLCARARGHAELAKLMLARAGLGLRDRCALFLEAEPQERAAIAAEATNRVFLTRMRPSPVARRDADEVVLSLAGHGKEKLAGTLTEWLGLRTEDARAIVDDATGEALVLALRACGAPSSSIVALLLRRGLHLSRSVERIFSLEGLARETSGAAAALIVDAFAQIRPRPLRHLAAPRPLREFASSGVEEPASAEGFKRRERKR